ncbi:MAG: methyltransferase domain-containing protein [Actinomycetia bacterium]|nr:methyltransferase domain-containing protein [Actinomycetes bacterium]
MARTIQTMDDVLRLLDSFFDDDADRWTETGAPWWDAFYHDRGRDIPFFRNAPDESLVGWYQGGSLGATRGQRALDLGCGPGRNAIWLAQQGYQVDAIDLSPAAIRWAQERAEAAQVEVNFIQDSIFEWRLPEYRYDLVYDSGCFHHLPPHRRISYRALLEGTLAPDGALGLACFAAGAMGSEVPDRDLYQEGSLSGGLAYTEDELRTIFDWLRTIELRRMQKLPTNAETFGQSFLWAALFRHHPSPGH